MTERLVAISIGNAIDREALGFPEREIKRVLFAACTAFIRHGYQIAYAGDLRPGDYTYDIFDFLGGTYAGQGTSPFVYIVPGSVTDRLTFEEAKELVERTRSVASILLIRAGQTFKVISSEGKLFIGTAGPERTTAQTQDEWSAFLQRFPAGTNAEALTDARRTIAGLASGCVAMGGKMGRVGFPQDQFQGRIPGIVEEALLYLEAGKPFVPFAAFGGATRDIAISLELLPEDERTPRAQDHGGYLAALEEVKLFREKDANVFYLLQKAATEETAEEVAQIALQIIDGPNG